MADNLSVTPGVGANIAADEITTRNGAVVAAELAQRVKVGWGVDGTFNDVNASTPIPVTSVVTSIPALPAGANIIGSVTQSGTWTVGVSGTVPVSLATNTPTIAAGAAIIGKVGIDQTTPGTTNAVSVTNASIAVTGTFWQATQPVSGTITANAGTGTFAVSAASLPLPTGAATSAKQPALGIAGTASTDVITVQGIASGVAQPVSGTFWQATQPVSFTQPALVAGTALIGKVGIDQTTVGTTNAVALAQIGANTILTGNGITGTGSQRVTIASDNTAFSVNAVQSGTWNITTLTSLSQFGGFAINLGAGAVSTGTLRTTQASDSPLVAATGATTDAAVANGAGGTALGYLRSIKDAATDTTTPSPVKLTDGTNVGTNKAASTAAVFTDTATVVEVRPGGAQVTASAVLADALTNPTLGRQAVLNALYNGTTWDLQRGMGGNATTGDTGAKTATGNGATQTNIGNKGVQLVLSLGTVTGTSPTLVLKVQGSADGGTTWYDIPGAATASLTTGSTVFGITVYPGIAVTAGTTTTGSTATANMPLPRTWRVVWTIGGTTPSFTITNIQYNYLVN